MVDILDKRCSRCGEVKPVSEFSKNRSQKNGLACQCKTCVKEYQEANVDKIRKQKNAYAARKKEYYKEYRKANVDAFILSQIKARAKKKGLDFSLELKDIQGVAHCPVFGYRLKRGEGKAVPTSPSVDRIDPSKGYTKDNIQILSQRANAMKQDASPEELILFAEWVLRTYKK